MDSPEPGATTAARGGGGVGTSKVGEGVWQGQGRNKGPSRAVQDPADFQEIMAERYFLDFKIRPRESS